MPEKSKNQSESLGKSVSNLPHFPCPFSPCPEHGRSVFVLGRSTKEKVEILHFFYHKILGHTGAPLPSCFAIFQDRKILR